MVTQNKQEFLLLALKASVALIIAYLYAANVQFQTSFANTTFQYWLQFLLAIGFTTGGLACAGVARMLFSKQHAIAGAIMTAAAIAIFIYESHGSIGFVSELNQQFEANSDIAKAEAEKVQLQQEKIDNLKTAIANRSTLVEQRNETANRYGVQFNKRKLAALSENEGMLKQNEAMQAQLNKEIERKTALLSAKIDDSNANHKAHAVFQHLSRFFNNGSIAYAKDWQSNVLIFIGVLAVIWVQIVPVLIAILEDHKPALAVDSLQPVVNNPVNRKPEIVNVNSEPVFKFKEPLFTPKPQPENSVFAANSLDANMVDKSDLQALSRASVIDGNYQTSGIGFINEAFTVPSESLQPVVNTTVNRKPTSVNVNKAVKPVITHCQREACGKEIQNPTTQRKYCSDSCKTLASRERKQTHA